MAKLITVLYNREDASEVIGIKVVEQTEFKDALKSGQALKQAFDFAKSRDPLQILMQPAQKGRFILDVEKSTRLTPDEKKRFIDLLFKSGPLDVATFGIGDRDEPLPPGAGVDKGVQVPELIHIFLDP